MLISLRVYHIKVYALIFYLIYTLYLSIYTLIYYSFIF